MMHLNMSKVHSYCVLIGDLFRLNILTIIYSIISFQSLFFTVTLPPNVYPGDTIRVQAPDGRMNEIIVPHGILPGDQFHVRFSTLGGPPPALATPIDHLSPSYSTSTSYPTPTPSSLPSYGASPYNNSPSTNDTFEGMSIS